MWKYTAHVGAMLGAMLGVALGAGNGGSVGSPVGNNVGSADGVAYSAPDDRCAYTRAERWSERVSGDVCAHCIGRHECS